jgi:predicted regulator of Ras-like GTPase activity (Roadblock/LC7/MglB family)
MSKIIAQQLAPQPQTQPQSQPLFTPDFFASVGVTGGILVMLVVAVAKTLPNYLTRFFELREASIKARLEAEIREQDSDLKREEGSHQILMNIINTLLANQLQTSRQFQEEFVSQMGIQVQQMGVILSEMGKSSQNQERFFQIATQLQRDLGDIRLEIERNRKPINDTASKQL